MTLLNVYHKNGKPANQRNNYYSMNDLMDEFTRSFTPSSSTSNPKVNIRETKDSFEMEFALPGLDKKDISLKIENDILSISSDKENKSEDAFTIREFDYSNFERSFKLPDTVDFTKISAKMNEGILLISIPKKDEAIDRGPRDINIL